jgi:hypothetical protein
MSRSRWGGFRKKLISSWNEIKAPSATLEEVPATVQDFDYTQAKGIWNLRSTTQFSKKNASTFGSGATTSTFINSYGIAASQTTYNFTTTSIPAGLAVVTVSSESNGDTTVSSVTIGGVSATQAAAFYQNGPVGTGSSIWYAVIESSTTSVVVSYPNAPVRCGIGVYTIENYTLATPVYNNVSPVNTTTSSITTSSISSGSAIIAVRTSGDVYSHTWSGVTEDYDNQIGGTGLTGQTGASLDTSTTQTHTIESVGDTTASQGTTMAVAVWS